MRVVRGLILGVVLACGLSSLSIAEEPVREHVLTLEYLKEDEAVRGLRLREMGLFHKVLAGRLVVRCGEEDITRIRELLQTIDLPMVNPVTKFVEVYHGDVETIAALLAAWFGQEEPPLSAIAQVRTSRVFLMGSPELIEIAEVLIDYFDRE